MTTLLLLGIGMQEVLLIGLIFCFCLVERRYLN